MARMIPKLNSFQQMPLSEEMTYKALEKGLDDNYTVYHHVAFLRTRNPDARIKRVAQGEVDFLIFHPAKGFLVIEVKGGTISYSENQWWSKSELGKIFEIKSPFEQAKVGMHFFQDGVQSVFPENTLNIPHGYAVCFPGCDVPLDVSFPAEGDRALVLDATNIFQNPQSIQDSINKIFEHWGTLLDPLDIDDIRALRKRVFEPSFSLLPSYRAVKEDLERSIFQLTNQQKLFLQLIKLKNRCLISGAAGTGKTVLALEMCKTLAEDGKSVLLLCYNTLFAQDCNARVNHPNIRILKFHDFCEESCKQAGIHYEIPKEKEQQKTFYMDQTPELLSQAIEVLNLQYDCIIIDEGQDFENLWWIPLMDLLKNEESWFYIFFDQEQNIFKRKNEFPIDGPPLSLEENCRNPSSINNFINDHFEHRTQSKYGMPEGHSPQLYCWNDEDDQNRQIQSVLEQLLKNGVALNEIVLLTAHNINNSECRHIKKTNKFKSLQMHSIMSFKGMEANVILLCDVGKDWLTNRKDLLYTGMSRAVVQLHVFHKKGFELKKIKK